MDTMVHKLEKYAENLENIVQERTALLVDEKQKNGHATVSNAADVVYFYCFLI